MPRKSIVGAFVLCLLALLGIENSARSQAVVKPSLHLRVVGGLAGLSQYTRHEEPFWTRRLAELTGGQASAEIVPFDRAGIRGEEMLRLVQAGAVPFGTALLSISSTVDAEVAAPDLAGLNPNIGALRRTAGAFRPYLERMLRERYGIELLALYIYPAQETFCKNPLKSLADLAGRRVRTSGASQADFIEAIGGIPVKTDFAAILPSLRSGNIECAITGTMSGNTIGLHEVTTHLHTLPITWGLSVFVANGASWRALPGRVQEILRSELPKLERDIWSESELETGQGVLCNIGSHACKGPRRGHMTEVPESESDQRLRRQLLTHTVLPRWIQRCGPQCAEVWRQTIGPVVGIELP